MGLGIDPTKLVSNGGYLNAHAPDKLAKDLSVQEAWAAFTATVSKLDPKQQRDVANRIAVGVLAAIGGIVDEEG
ncbi:hypothetical protein [Streptomyces aureoversilis]|uniref:Uncharacterized protein n=1 Tax=Streptomyces aureoversilis TaxID=67277 RepID=A0ABV9ZT46_9ACTN